jgi:adenylate cyclase
MKQVDGLAFWLAENAGLPLAEVHAGFCRELVQRGIPLWRSSLGMELLHPEQSGKRFAWSADGASEVTMAPRGVEMSDAYLYSPVKIIDDTERPFRRRLAGRQELPLLEELRQAGGTDYAIYPLPFLDRTRSAYLSFTTNAPEGFSEEDLALLALAARLISPYAERTALRRMAIDLLDTYVGRHAGERIFSGQIKRGAVDTIEAAILMSDLRGFTEMSKKQARPVLIETLNAWFDGMASAVETHDGEILKFMGDGLLAIFRTDGAAGEACLRAYAAASEAGAAIATLNVERRRAKHPAIGFAMGLHVGEVAYGNVGGRQRLDFTVLGPAVNYAARLQDLAKRLNQPLLVSRAFADRIAQPLTAFGAHPLRGIGRAEEVFAPAKAA